MSMIFQLLNKDKKKVGKQYKHACLFQLPYHLSQIGGKDWKYIRYTILTNPDKVKEYINHFSKVFFFGEYLKQGEYTDDGVYYLDLDVDVVPQFELTSILTVLRWWDEENIGDSLYYTDYIQNKPDLSVKEFMHLFLMLHQEEVFNTNHSLFESNWPDYQKCSFESLINKPKVNPLVDKKNPKFFEFSLCPTAEIKEGWVRQQLFSYYRPINISKVKNEKTV